MEENEKNDNNEENKINKENKKEEENVQNELINVKIWLIMKIIIQKIFRNDKYNFVKLTPKQNFSKYLK